MPMNGDMPGRGPQLRPIPKEDFDIQGALERFKKDDLAQVGHPTLFPACPLNIVPTLNASLSPFRPWHHLYKLMVCSCVALFKVQHEVLVIGKVSHTMRLSDVERCIAECSLEPKLV